MPLFHVLQELTVSQMHIHAQPALLDLTVRIQLHLLFLALVGTIHMIIIQPAIRVHLASPVHQKAAI